MAIASTAIKNQSRDFFKQGYRKGPKVLHKEVRVFGNGTAEYRRCKLL